LFPNMTVYDFRSQEKAREIGALDRWVNPAAFAKGAYATSWACNTGTIDSSAGMSFSDAWTKHTNVPMAGIVGKSNYVTASSSWMNNPIGIATRYNLPLYPSLSQDSKWYRPIGWSGSEREGGSISNWGRGQKYVKIGR
jgi:hypothetical protein